MGRIRVRLKQMKTSSKIKIFLIIFFIAIFAIITARHFIGLHFKKKFSVRPAPGVIVSTVEKSLFYKSIETFGTAIAQNSKAYSCLLYTSPSPRDKRQSRMPSSA